MQQLEFDFSTKTRWDLVPHDQLIAIAEVLTHGAVKHGGKSYLDVSVEDHYAAHMRHLMAWRSGNTYDDETGHSHLVHAMCRLMFIAEIDRLSWQADDAIGVSISESVQTLLDRLKQVDGWKAEYLRGGKDFAPESD